MGTRRELIETAGALLAGGGLLKAQSRRREIRIGGKRVKVIDAHAHASVTEVGAVIKGTPFERFTSTGGRPLGPDRIQELDKRGIDVQALHVLDINGFWWYKAERDLAARIVRVHDDVLSAWCAANPRRFVAFTSPALQFPELAAQQIEYAVKKLGMRGAAIGGHVAGESISLPKYDPFWAKVQDLGVVVFMHPNNDANIVTPEFLSGAGDLRNIIGNPLETTLFLAHLIFDGTFDRFPGIRVCGAHGGGYLPSYLGRADVACDVRPNARCVNRKHPREYLRDQIFADSLVFSPEGIRHLVTEMGPGQVVYGTDIPFAWPDSIEPILQADISDDQKESILGANMTKLLKL